ncbi:NAD+ dependent histone deacetylase [Komagataella phaffii CBS 7435]|uniref:Conserved NAD+ dependent histone deacetylase of the Sirtuin family n=2 Tax=Komagataella phaffii TaxID=460519 RepID=C4QWX8_KOMPG|nr:Conserved NAD+ dependent histone deacetylase of the Sirtuin family [Komagataella phaffii GS115]AOA60649.1 GQ67_02959T0 [Komagataella phaffii]CAH2446545.1 NAD+ dependent histone deacetylase [Komagataella phaffii CBS 7435]AOA65670.1 GQ68_02288T0 [Komagataella phaffii GS115]CAY67751.1 Conserved NAD+ dependent histone deacetylase of the Sirtuin family [Komagataella phaffii GS115]CCA36838.1 NAD+ dependent histone deacetylase [Komagataella phaffii CBS 7435]
MDVFEQGLSTQQNGTQESNIDVISLDSSLSSEQEAEVENNNASSTSTSSSKISRSNDILSESLNIIEYEIPSHEPMTYKDAIHYNPTKEDCYKTRLCLKAIGISKFIDLSLSETPGASDFVYLIKLLGFAPKEYPEDENSTETVYTLVKYLQRAMHRVITTRTKKLDFHTIDHLIEAIKTSKNILVLTGAGISTSLGIPDFRSSEGFYTKLQEQGLDDPQTVFDLEYFKQDPSLFYSIAHLVLPPEGSFTPLHGFIKLLADKGSLLRNYTQNIDNLEANAGIPSEKVIQCHGSFATASCITCKYKIPGETIFEEIRNSELPLCPFCIKRRQKLIKEIEALDDSEQGISRHSFSFLGSTVKRSYAESYGVMKPDITFFGEDLPRVFHDNIIQDVKNCDLLLCIGTSLKVAPVSEIVNKVKPEIPQVLINKDPVTHTEFDISLLGYCDELIVYLCEAMGWKIDHPKVDELLDSIEGLMELEGESGRYQLVLKEEESQEVTQLQATPIESSHRQFQEASLMGL